MKNYELLEPMNKDGNRHDIGEIVALDAKTAADKLAIGVIREAKGSAAASAPPPRAQKAKPLNMQKGDELVATAAAEGVEIPADVTGDKAIRALIKATRDEKAKG